MVEHHDNPPGLGLIYRHMFNLEIKGNCGMGGWGALLGPESDC